MGGCLGAPGAAVMGLDPGVAQMQVDCVNLQPPCEALVSISGRASANFKSF